MGIQLNERDKIIFKLIEEHRVLLEKHIAWFISDDEKPVLIRDRLRKLFYLDYLLCRRHTGQLSWWTTPTKPLVYMLAPISRLMVTDNTASYSNANTGSSENLDDALIQKHFLEIANLRMLFLMDQKSGLIQDFQWITGSLKGIQAGSSDTQIEVSSNVNADTGCTNQTASHVDSYGDLIVSAVVSFTKDNNKYKIAIINQSSVVQPDKKILTVAEEQIKTGAANMVWIISQDNKQQKEIQNILAGSSYVRQFAFTTHQEAYKNGLLNCSWQKIGQSATTQNAPDITKPQNWKITPATA